MVPHRRPYGRRALLPYELDLCTQLGVTPDEYWEFLFDAQEYALKRSKEYELIPDIRNEAAVTTALINLVIGIALTAASALLAPKPKSQDTKGRENLEIPGRQGRTRYTKSTSFDSIQQLAQLGDTIPLVFANQQKIGDDTFGGVRMDTDLLFSQMVSNGNNQLLYALLSLGMAELGEKPDYDGIAIGDLLLRDFSPYKNRMFYGANKRLTSSEVYTRSKLWESGQGMLTKYENPNDVFSIQVPFVSGQRWKPDLSGARTPTTAVQFGCFSPLPNGHRFYMPFELVMVPDGDQGQQKVAREGQRVKRRKLSFGFPRMAGITGMDRSRGLVTYSIYNSDRKIYDENSPAARQFKETNSEVPKFTSDFKPWGLSDPQSIQDETRILADEALQENQQFLLGSTLAMLIKRSTTDIYNKESKINREYVFRIEENFADLDGKRIPIPKSGKVNRASDLTAMDLDRGGATPWSRGTVQQVAIASITNNRQCDITELGIKSEVWRQMVNSFNFNGCPTKNTVTDYEEVQANITVGTVTAYMRRYSFFRLYARPLGYDKWINITKPNVRAFAVLGATPTSKYNTISIKHPQRGIFEYRLVPVPGSEFYENNTAQIVLLDARTLNDPHLSYSVATEVGSFSVAVTGSETGLGPQNSEWFPNSVDVPARLGNTGPILRLNRYDNGLPIPEKVEPKKDAITKYERSTTRPSYVERPWDSFKAKDRTFIWEGKVKKGTIIDRKTIEIEGEKGFRKVRYIEGKTKQAAVNPHWEATEDDNDGHPRYDLGENPGNPSGYKACVYYAGRGVWHYVWGGKIKATYRGVAGDGGTPSWVQGQQASSKKRYKRYGEVIREEYKPKPNEQDKFIITNGQLIQGAVKSSVHSNKLDFYNDGRFIGQGTDNFPRRYTKSETLRWVADSRQQREVELTPNRLPNTPDNGSIVTAPGLRPSNGGVTDGVIIKNMGKSNEKYTFYWQGERIAQEVSDAIITVNNVKYRLVGGNDGRLVGLDTDLPCYPINVTQLELWSISKEIKSGAPLTYQIVRQTYVDGQNEFSEIKQEIYSVRPAKPVNKKVPIIRRTTDPFNTSATADVNYYPLDAETGTGSGRIEWTLDSEINGGDDYRVGDEVRIGTQDDNPFDQTKNGPKAIVQEIPPVVVEDDENPGYWKLMSPGNPYAQLNAICDYYINDTETSSHANGPEHTVVFCNEIIDVPPVDKPTYNNLSLLGLKITNSKEWSSFNSVSAYIAKGLKVKQLERNDALGSTNLFPNIAYALLTDPVIGAGDAIGSGSVDKAAMRTAAQYCQANSLFWDGVIDQAVNLREFIYENAAYVLCDFTVKGGKFSLIPSLPLNAAKQIDREGRPPVKALFTDGVVRNTQVSFLTPEERQPFQAVCLYRSEVKNGFSEVRSMLTRFNKRFDASTELAPIEEFDMTRFCTSEAHARIFSRVALMLRAKVDHSIKFETTPQAAMTMEPGDYFRFASKVTHTDRFASGVIDDKGYVNSSEPTNGSYDIVYWKPGTVGLSNARLTVGADGRTTQTGLYGVLWSKVETQQSTRIYKCESLSYSDDGLVEVAGSFAPLTPRGTLQILDWGPDTFEEEID